MMLRKQLLEEKQKDKNFEEGYLDTAALNMYNVFSSIDWADGKSSGTRDQAWAASTEVHAALMKYSADRSSGIQGIANTLGETGWHCAAGFHLKKLATLGNNPRQFWSFDFKTNNFRICMAK